VPRVLAEEEGGVSWFSRVEGSKKKGKARFSSNLGQSKHGILRKLVFFQIWANQSMVFKKRAT
jgi:hypothetical protein